MEGEAGVINGSNFTTKQVGILLCIFTLDLDVTQHLEEVQDPCVD